MRKRVLGIIVFAVFFSLIVFFYYGAPQKVSADELSDDIENALGNLDLSDLENFYNENVQIGEDSFAETLKKLLEGKYDFSYDNLLKYAFNVVFDDFFKMLPTFLSVIAICVLCAIISGLKSSIFNEELSEIIFFVCSLCVILLLFSVVLSVWQSAKKTIKNIAVLCEITTPAILTLMIASGGTVSASVYKPSVLFLSNGIIAVVEKIVFPLVGIMIVFSVINAFSKNVRFNKFADAVGSAIKWIIGISFTVYGLFLTVQGITSASFDGISLKAAKYAISNSVPIVGGYLRDGFDLVVAGSVLIKNAIGITGVVALFFIILSPIVKIVAASVLLKITAGFAGALSAETPASGLCTELNKGMTYTGAAVLCSGLAFFVTMLLMTVSACAFI